MHALISGASVAGPTLAYWLHHHGWQVTVVERAGSPRAGDGGHAVDLFGPAVDVIERMGLLDRVRAARTRNDTITLLRPGRNPITVATADLVGGFTVRHVEIMRGTLAALLHEACGDGPDFRFGTVIDELDGTTARLSDGTTITADLVVGADGLHSGVRALAFGPESLHRRFLGAYLAVYSAPDVLGTGETVAAFSAPGLAATVYPVGPGMSRALFLARSAEEIPHDRRDRDAQKRILRRLAGERLGPRAAAVLEHLDEAGDFYLDDVSQIRMDSWTRGRVTLVGDAGYGPGPAVGGGTSLAVAGAYLLAAELANAGSGPDDDPLGPDNDQLGVGKGRLGPGDVEAALRRYEAALADPVRHSRRISPSILNSIVPRNRAQVWLTAQVMRALPQLPEPVRRRLTSFGGGPAAMLDGLALPEPQAARR